MNPENKDYEPLDRRPVASREIGVFKKMAFSLAQKGVTPNAISVASMGFAVVAGLALYATSVVESAWEIRLLWLLAAAGIQLRLVANMLDGMVAIESGKASPVGELFNEAPDRLSDGAILIGAGYAFGGIPEFGYLAALLAVGVAYVRALGASAGAGQAFLGPMAKPHRMFVLTLAFLYSAFTPIAWQPLLLPDRGGGVMALVLLIISVGCLVTTIRRLLWIAADLRRRPTYE